jgi:hypothetical protein
MQRGRKIHIQCTSSTDDSDGRYVDQDFETSPSFDYQGLMKQNPPNHERVKFWTPELCLRKPHLFDFVITVPPTSSLSFLTAARRRRNSVIRILALSTSSSPSSLLFPRVTRISNPLRLLRLPVYPGRILRQRRNSPSTNEI